MKDINSKRRSLSMSGITSKIKEVTGGRLMISSDKEIKNLIEEFVLDRAITGLAKSLEEVLRVCKKKIVTPAHLKIALSTQTL